MYDENFCSYRGCAGPQLTKLHLVKCNEQVGNAKWIIGRLLSEKSPGALQRNAPGDFLSNFANLDKTYKITRLQRFPV